MAEYAPDQNFKHPVCRGSWALGNNCKVCERCQATHPGSAGTQLLTNPKHTDTSRSGDLVKRLRKARVWPDYSQSRVTIETAHEAADRIEALEAENERLTATLSQLNDTDIVARTMAENERLRNAMVVMDNTVRELTEALREMFEAVCGETGFAQAVRAESGIAYPWPALDLAEAMARAALKEIEGD